MRKSIFISLIVLVIIGFFLLGYFTGTLRSLIKKEAIVQQTEQELKERFLKAKLIPPEPEKIFSLSGSVKDKKQNYLILIPSIKQDPFRDIFPKEVKVIINENTKITKKIAITIERYKDELKKCRTSGECHVNELFGPYYEQSTSFDDIQIGSYLYSVTSKNNIKHTNEFIAQEITFFD